MFTQSVVRVQRTPKRREVNIYEARAKPRGNVEWKPKMKYEPERTVNLLKRLVEEGKVAISTKAQYPFELLRVKAAGSIRNCVNLPEEISWLPRRKFFFR